MVFTLCRVVAYVTEPKGGERDQCAHQSCIASVPIRLNSTVCDVGVRDIVVGISNPVAVDGMIIVYGGEVLWLVVATAWYVGTAVASRGKRVVLMVVSVASFCDRARPRQNLLNFLRCRCEWKCIGAQGLRIEGQYRFRP